MAKAKPRGRPMPQNLKPFPKGVSGNPGGRPKYKAISEAIRHILTLDDIESFVPSTVAEKLALTRIRQAMLKGGLYEAEYVTDRAEGKAVATVRSTVNLSDAEFVFDILSPDAAGSEKPEEPNA